MPAEALELAAAVGVPRIVQIGCDLPGARWAVETAAAVRRDRGRRRDPSQRGAAARRRGRARRRARRDRAAGVVSPTGPGGRRDRARLLPHRPRRCGGTEAVVRRAHRRWRERLDKTLVIHDRDAHDDVLAMLDEHGMPERTVLHCFSGDADFARACLDRGAYLSFAGTVTFKNADLLRHALQVAPIDRILVETDAPFLTPMPYRGRTERVVPRAAHRARDGRDARRRPRDALSRDRRQHRRGLRRSLGLGDVTDSRLLGAADVRALASRHGIRPTKQRGQNFVIDANTVRRIVAAAGLCVDDIVLEVGPGLGSLTLGLLPDAARVIAVEVDPALAAALPSTVGEFAPALTERLSVLEMDALALRPDDARLPAPPTALVANLPYNVAVPVLLELLTAFDSIERVLVMVQLEVADRLAAAPGSRVYGVPSVKAAWFGDVRRVGSSGATSSGPRRTSTRGWCRSCARRLPRRPRRATTCSRSSTRPSPSAARRCALRSRLSRAPLHEPRRSCAQLASTRVCAASGSRSPSSCGSPRHWPRPRSLCP